MPPSGLENKYWELIRTHGSAHMGYPNAALWAREGKPENRQLAIGVRHSAKANGQNLNKRSFDSGLPRW